MGTSGSSRSNDDLVYMQDKSGVLAAHAQQMSENIAMQLDYHRLYSTTTGVTLAGLDSAAKEGKGLSIWQGVSRGVRHVSNALDGASLNVEKYESDSDYKATADALVRAKLVADIAKVQAKNKALEGKSGNKVEAKKVKYAAELEELQQTSKNVETFIAQYGAKPAASDELPVAGATTV